MDVSSDDDENEPSDDDVSSDDDENDMDVGDVAMITSFSKQKNAKCTSNLEGGCGIFALCFYLIFDFCDRRTHSTQRCAECSDQNKRATGPWTPQYITDKSRIAKRQRQDKDSKGREWRRRHRKTSAIDISLWKTSWWKCLLILQSLGLATAPS